MRYARACNVLYVNYIYIQAKPKLQRSSYNGKSRGFDLKFIRPQFVESLFYFKVVDLNLCANFAYSVYFYYRKRGVCMCARQSNI